MTKLFNGNFKRYMQETMWNKIFAVVLILIGLVSAYILKDCTYLLLTKVIGTPLFFSKKNYILL